MCYTGESSAIKMGMMTEGSGMQSGDYYGRFFKPNYHQFPMSFTSYVLNEWPSKLVIRLLALQRSRKTLSTLLTLLVLSSVHLPNVHAQHRPNQPPIFSNGGDLARFSIPEDTPVGSVIYRLKGTDPENGELTYSISGEYFRVNKKTGDLTLIKALDREVEPSIDAIISLTDDGHGSEPATISLRREIVIEDRNDNPPVFTKRPYSVSVPEETRVGSTVFSDILITDEDWAANAEISLTCAQDETPLACQTFSVSAEQVDEGKYIGIITLAMPLDFEKVRAYALTLRASDGQNIVTAPITITVKDIQDARPNFIGGPYVFSVKENVHPGTFVGSISVQDGDVGNPRDLQLKLIDEAGNNYFRLANIQKDSFTGIFSAIVETSDNELDAEDEFIRDNLGVYELVLEAREYPLSPDDTEPTLVTRTAVAVVIEDDDDFLPSFIPPTFLKVFKVPFNPGEGYVFPDFMVEVEDKDASLSNARFSLKFDWVTGPPAPEVQVEDVFSFVTPSNSNPLVQNKGVISMEILNVSLLIPGSKFDLQIGAYQNDHIVSKINVPIEVATGPKQVPKFNATVYRVKAPESLLEGDTVTQVSVSNKIPGIKYSLIGITADRFEVEETTGVIKCRRKCLDYEKEKSHFFLVKAKSGAGVDDVVFSLLYVDVIETNDNYPVFDEIAGTLNGQVRRSVPDGTTKFNPRLYITATDEDLGDRVTYSVQDLTMNDSGVYIQPETGELKLQKPLRWAVSGEHRLVVTATDLVGHQTNRSVVLIVQAVNNLKPSFPYNVHHVNVSETMARGTAIFKAIAHDPDGQDAAIRYSIDSQPEPDLFLIEENSGTIRLNGELDFEQKQRVYPVVVRAQDEGKPSEWATATIEIQVMDENDENPKFVKRNFVADMSESEQPEVIIMGLSAWDPDDGSDLEYEITCPCKVWDGSGSQLSQDDAENMLNNFRIEPVTGEIILLNNIAFKKSAAIEFQAIVTDLKGMKTQTDNSTVTIYVLVAERTKPIFGPPWTPGNPWINVTVPENIDVGSTIVTFNAFDYIAGEHISNFTLVDSDSEFFELHGNELKTIDELDYEFRKQFILSVKAVDIRGGESTANVAIELQDVNDNTAVFSKPEYKGKVKENSEYPTPILTVEATDRDDIENYGAVRYALTGPNSNLFQVDELAGVIQVAPGAIIDREDIPHHTLTVLAMDTPAGGPFQRTATATVQIAVEDVNDVDPVCKIPEILVPENALVGTPFGSINCTDKDENTKLMFTIKDDLKLNLFAIDSATGALTVAKSLRGRGRSAPYILGLVVEDGKERTISLTLPIIITNVIPNDGRPYFVNDNFTAVISEGAHRSTPVLLIKAQDTDSYDNGEGRLLYRILKQIYPCHSKSEVEAARAAEHPEYTNMTKIEDVNYFRVDEQTGMLSLRERVDREKHDCFSLLVAVEDLGTPPQMETQWFEIHVQDVDDNLPFLPKHMRTLDLKVNETVTKGSAVFNFTAEDFDIYPNNRVSFEISGGGGDLFKIQSAGTKNSSLILNGDLTLLEHNDLTLVIKCFPKEKKVSLPDCISKIRISILRDSENLAHYVTGRLKLPEMVLGVAAGTSVGNLIGNLRMPVKSMEGSMLMYHPNAVSQAPYNASGALKVDTKTGDIFTWDVLDKYQNGHFRMEVKDHGSSGLRKNLKVFVASNSQLLNADTADFARISKWVDDVDRVLNLPSKDPRVRKGVFKLLTYDQSNAPDGKTKICFQLLENENMVSQEKATQLLEEDELKIVFLKYSFDGVEKGCPERARAPARLTYGAATGRFWVERSLLGIASVVAIATISAILILCLLNRHRVKDDN